MSDSNQSPLSDSWNLGDPYERYMGRWSRRIAPLFVDWLGAPRGARWLEIGCGTGALSAAVLERAEPASVAAVEPSDGFRELAARNLGARATVHSGSASDIPLDDASVDVVVSGLVLNFVPDLPAAFREMRRVAAPGGTVAAYLWDYADGMEITRRFWDAAVALDPAAEALHEGARFPLCAERELRAAFEGAGLEAVVTGPLDLVARFESFADYWTPFLGGQGPAPAYAVSLPEDQREDLRASLHAALSFAADGSLELRARAWAVRGRTERE